MVGCPSHCDFKAMIRTVPINNFPVTVKYITISNKIFGPDVSSLKGETVRKNLAPVITDYVQITSLIQNLNKK